MTTDAGFLQAILEQPADDAPRLIFADRLDEVGTEEAHARAEFIRVQCALEPLRRHGHGTSNPHGGACETCQRVARMESRERRLLATFGRQWCMDGAPDGAAAEEFGERNPRLVWLLPSNPDQWVVETDPLVGLGFCRGFIESLTLDGNICRRYLDVIRERNPIREVTLSHWPSIRRWTTNNSWRTEERYELWAGTGFLAGRASVTLAYSDQELLSLRGSSVSEEAWLSMRRRRVVAELLRNLWSDVTFYLPEWEPVFADNWTPLVATRSSGRHV